MLHYLGVADMAGLITVMSVLGETGGIIFGMSQIPWFFWLGFI